MLGKNAQVDWGRKFDTANFPVESFVCELEKANLSV